MYLSILTDNLIMLQAIRILRYTYLPQLWATDCHWGPRPYIIYTYSCAKAFCNLGCDHLLKGQWQWHITISLLKTSKIGIDRIVCKKKTCCGCCLALSGERIEPLSRKVSKAERKHQIGNVYVRHQHEQHILISLGRCTYTLCTKQPLRCYLTFQKCYTAVWNIYTAVWNIYTARICLTRLPFATQVSTLGVCQLDLEQVPIGIFQKMK